MTKRRKIIGALIAALVLAAVGCIGFALRGISGIYLVEGGLGCIEIRRDVFWNTQLESQYPKNENARLRLGAVWPKLRLDWVIPPGSNLYGWYTTDTIHAIRFVEMKRSRGGWDAVALGDAQNELSTTVPLSLALGKPMGWFRALLERWFPRLAPRPVASTRSWGISAHQPPQRHALAQRVPYLHRVNDRHALEVFRLADLGNFSGAHQTARALLRDHPNDPYLQLLYLYTATRVDAVSDVGDRIAQWGEALRSHLDPHLARGLEDIEIWHRGRRLSAEGRNAYNTFASVSQSTASLAARLALIASIPEGQDYVAETRIWASQDLSNYLPVLVQAKVFRVVATLWMIEGRRQDSLRVLAGTFRLGQAMNREPRSLIVVLIGIAIKSIASGGLETLALNACETEEEFRRMWDELERLAGGEYVQPLSKLRRPYHVIDWFASINIPNYMEVETRNRTANARFQLVRSATAGKYRFTSRGDFPSTQSEFAPFLPNGLPADPFSSGPIRFLRTTDSLLCYSVGPDRRDDLAAITYDPTNGTLSAGDLITRVPRERQFPFPREGVRAATPEDLKRQFPNGLPPDIFATMKGRPLGVTRSATNELIIYSFGPDTDEYKGSGGPPDLMNGFGDPEPNRPRGGHVLQPPYDPTNGIVSDGDIFIRVPRP